MFAWRPSLVVARPLTRFLITEAAAGRAAGSRTMGARRAHVGKDRPHEARAAVLPPSAVPVKVGVVSRVALSVSELPKSEAAIRSGVDGAAGGGIVDSIDSQQNRWFASKTGRMHFLAGRHLEATNLYNNLLT